MSGVHPRAQVGADFGVRLWCILRVFPVVRILRVLLAGLITLTALLAGAFAAAVILFTGLVGFLIQLFWRKGGAPSSRPQPTPPGRSAMRTGDAIDVVATQVPTKLAKR